MSLSNGAASSTWRVSPVNRTNSRQTIVSVFAKSCLLTHLTVTTCVVALSLHIPPQIRVAVFVTTGLLLLMVDAVPRVSRAIGLSASAFIGIGATWASTQLRHSPSTDIAISGIATALVLIAARQIYRHHVSRIRSSVILGVTMSLLYESILVHENRSLFSDQALVRFTVMAVAISIVVIILIAILASEHQHRPTRHSPDENAYGWLLALRATLVLAFIFFVFSGLVV